MIANLRNVDDELAIRVAAGLGIDLPEKAKAARKPIDMEPSPALSLQKNMKQTIEGRAIGILYADGSDGKAIQKLVDAVRNAAGKPVLIAPRVGGAKLADGKMLKADGQLAGTPSQTVDAIALVLSSEGARALLKDAAAIQFVMDAFGHLKAIGASAAAQPLLDKAGVAHDSGVTGLGDDFLAAAAKRFWDREAKIRPLA
jgi:catalase